MKPFRSLLIFLALAATLLLGGTPAGAAGGFSFALDADGAAAGETVGLRMNLGGSAAIAAFRLRVSFDDAVLGFEEEDTASAIAAGTLRVNSGSGWICAVYACNPGKNGAPNLSGTVVTLRFRVREDAAHGGTELAARVDETCDYAGGDLGLDAAGTLSLDVGPESAGARLKALVPSSGDLTPPFSPEVFDYALRVDPDVGSVVFRTETEDGAQAKASRTGLLAAGKETPILITVTSADRRKQASYLVTVLRASRDAGGVSEKEKEILKGSEEVRKELSSKSSRTASSPLPRETGGKNPSSPRPVSAVPSVSGTAAPPAGITFLQNGFPAWLGYCFAAAFFAAVGVIAGLCAGRKKK